MPNQQVTEDGTVLDPKVLKVMRAIRQVESGGSYNAVGDSGAAHGAFQYNEQTGPGWKNLARQYLGDENAPMDKGNQNKVTYYRIKAWKDEGKQPDEIAALWNGASKDPATGRYTYNNPQYGERFRAALMAGQAPVPQPPQVNAQEYSQTQPQPEPEGDGVLASMVKDPLKTLLVQPALRAGQVFGAGALSFADKLSGGKLNKLAYERTGRTMADTFQDTFSKPTETPFFGITADPVKGFDEGGAKQIGGEALKTASYLYAPKGAETVLKTGRAGKILRTGLEFAKTGGITGAAYGAGQAMVDDKTTPEIATEGALYGAIGAGTGGVLGVGGAALRPLIKREEYVTQKISEDVRELLTSGRAMTNATELAKQKNIPIQEILSDPEVFRGIQVADNRIAPDDAVAVIDDRIDAYMKAKSNLLPELDRVTMPVSRETVREEAKAAMRGVMSPADERAILSAIDAQVDALPEQMTLSQLDGFRARFRASARNARGLQKSQSEYAALENATRDVLFKATDNLPFDTNKEFPALNNEIKNLIGARDFIDKVLRGRNAPKAGWGTETAARMVGGMAGMLHGPLMVVAGSHLGGQLEHIIRNKTLGNSLKMKLIKNLTKDPKVLKEAEKLLAKAKGYDPLKARLALPAPKAIPLGPETPKPSTVQGIPAPKGEPGRTPKGQPGGGKFFRTYSSEMPQEKGLIQKAKDAYTSYKNLPPGTKQGGYVAGKSGGEGGFLQKQAHQALSSPKDTIHARKVAAAKSPGELYELADSQAELVPVGKITMDEDLMRAAEDVRKGIKAKSKLPILVELQPDGSYIVKDGRHRLVQQATNGREDVWAITDENLYNLLAKKETDFQSTVKAHPRGGTKGVVEYKRNNSGLIKKKSNGGHKGDITMMKTGALTKDMPDQIISQRNKAALSDKIKGKDDIFPIQVDETGRILDGHHRFEIAQERGYSEIPTFNIDTFSLPNLGRGISGTFEQGGYIWKWGVDEHIFDDIPETVFSTNPTKYLNEHRGALQLEPVGKK